MNIRVLIVEDDPITCQDLKEILGAQKFDVVGTASSYDQALKKFHSYSPDLLLIDVKLKGERDGIDLIEAIHAELDTYPPVVYLTANSDPGTKQRAFETKPAVFLTKPFHEKDLLISLELAFSNYSSAKTSREGEEVFFVKTTDHYIKVHEKEILFVKAEGSYSRITTENKGFLLSTNLNTCAQKLNNPRFIRIHRSYLLNQERITAVDHNEVFIGDHKFPIGRSYKQSVSESLRKIS